MEMGQQAREAVVAAAHLALRQWSQRLGTAGMAAMRGAPGLRAEVDQHVARIRDTLGRPRPTELAAYADGVADAATRRGWSAGETDEGWHRASWPSVHLLAVCVLAETTR